MNKPKCQFADPDIQASARALARAARAARRLAESTATPLYVERAGKIVNLNPAAHGRRKIVAAA